MQSTQPTVNRPSSNSTVSIELLGGIMRVPMSRTLRGMWPMRCSNDLMRRALSATAVINCVRTVFSTRDPSAVFTCVSSNFPTSRFNLSGENAMASSGALAAHFSLPLPEWHDVQANNTVKLNASNFVERSGLVDKVEDAGVGVRNWI